MHIEFEAPRPKSGRAVRVGADLWRARPCIGRAEYFAMMTWPGGYFETHVVGEGGTRVQIWKHGRSRDLTPDRARRTSGFWYAESSIGSMDDWARCLADYVRDRAEGKVEA